MLSDRDTKDLMSIQQRITDWKSIMDETRTEIQDKENRFRKAVEAIRGDLNVLKRILMEIAPM